VADAARLKGFLKSWIEVVVKGGFEKQRVLLHDIRERVLDELGEPNEPLRMAPT